MYTVAGDSSLVRLQRIVRTPHLAPTCLYALPKLTDIHLESKRG